MTIASEQPLMPADWGFGNREADQQRAARLVENESQLRASLIDAIQNNGVNEMPRGRLEIMPTEILRVCATPIALEPALASPAWV